MFALGNDGRIVGRIPGVDTKPAPFVSSTARWDGDKWVYNDPKLELPKLPDSCCLNAFDLQCHCIDLISPKPGTYRKPKTKEYSILIPAYGKKEYVKDTIGSCLKQTVLPVEVVVLDMDDEVESDSPIVRVVKHERLNASAARNLLVDICKTEQFIFLDADDMLEADAAEKLLAAPQNIVGLSVKHMEKSGYVHEKGSFVGWEERPFSIVNYNLTELLCKEMFYELGGLDESLASGGEDSDFNLRIFEQGKWDVGFLQDAFFLYRINVNGLSTKKAFVKSKELEMHKHAKQLIKWLENDSDSRPLVKDWSSKWKPLAVKLLQNFLSVYKYRLDNDVLQIPATINDSLEMQKVLMLAKWLCDNAELIEESSKRPTKNVCNVPIPIIADKQTDLVVDSWPTYNVRKEDVVFAAPGIDLSKSSEELMQKYNVVWLREPLESVTRLDLNYTNIVTFSGEECLFCRPQFTNSQ